MNKRKISKIDEIARIIDGIELVLPPSWTWTELEEVASNDKNAIVDGPFGSNLKISDYIEDDNGIPVLTTKNLTRGYERKNLRYISYSKFEEVKRSEVKSEDILVAKIGSCGKTGIYPKSMSSAIIPANLLKMTVHHSIKNLYVYHFLNSSIFQKELSTIITSTAQPAFNVSKFRQLIIPIAPLPEQERIVAAIEQQFSRIDAGVTLFRQAQKKLKQYRASVLQAAIEGTLTAEWRTQHPDVEPASELLKRILKERREKREEQQTKGRDPKKVHYVEPVGPAINDLPKLPDGWCWATLEQISDENRAITYGVVKLGDPVAGGVPTLRSSNVRHLKLDNDEVKSISPEIANSYKRTFLQGGEILVTIRGTLGGVVSVPKNLAGYNISREVAMIACVLTSLSRCLALFIVSINTKLVTETHQRYYLRWYKY